MAMPTSYPRDYVESTQDAQVERNAIEAAEWTMNEAVNLAERIQGEVERLCGQAPNNAVGNVEKLSSSGVLPSLKDRSERAAEVIRRAHSALDRLGRSI